MLHGYCLSSNSKIIMFCVQIIILTKCYSLMTGILTSHCKTSPLHRMVNAPSKGCSVL